MTKVSVIIPCYNSERFLSECLDSVLAQSLREIEIICVDDGSTDRTLKMLNDYAAKDNRICVISQENQFAGVARNKGIEIARGKYLAFLDSDDFFESVMLEKMFEKCERDNADICICGGGIYDMVTGRLSIGGMIRPNVNVIPKVIPFSPSDIPKDISRISTAAAWNKLYRADFVRIHGLHFQSIKRANDIYFTFTAMVMAERITVIDQWFVYHRKGTATSLVETIGDGPYYFHEAMRSTKKFLIDQGIYEKYEESFVKTCLSSCHYALTLVKTKEQWLKLALFAKYKYIPEFNLWKKPNSTGIRNDKTMSLIMNSSSSALEKHEPNLRRDETSAEFRDEAWHFPLSEGLKVSVIIPVYNTEMYLEECISSVLRQTLNDIEIICVNDGSTDTSMEILKQFAKKDERIKIVSQENQGLSGARNSGLRVACGEYVFFLDADDLLPYFALEHAYRQAKYHNLDDLFFEAYAFYDPPELFWDNPNYLSLYSYKEYYSEPDTGIGMLYRLLRKGQWGDLKTSACTRLFRRKFLEENNIRFPPGILHEDNIFTLRTLHNAERVWVYREPLYFRRVRPDSIMTVEKSWKNVYAYYLCLIEVEKLFVDVSEKKVKLIIEKLNSRFKHLLLSAYRGIPEKKWLDFPDNFVQMDAVHLPSILSFTIKMAQREASLTWSENKLKEIYRSRSWKLAKIIASPGRLKHKVLELLIPLFRPLKPIVFRSRMLTLVMRKIFK